MNHQKKLWQRVVSWVGIAVSVLLLPILVFNLILIAKSRFDPDRVPGILGIMPMVVITESMSPEITGGDLIFTKEVPAEELSVGDVIAFFDPSMRSSSVITHRITAITISEDGSLQFTTRGDANTEDDPVPVPEANLVGLYRGKIPKIGQAALYMRTVPGLILFVLFPVILFAVLEVMEVKREEKRKSEENDELRQELERLRHTNENAEIRQGHAAGFAGDPAIKQV